MNASTSYENYENALVYKEVLKLQFFSEKMKNSSTVLRKISYNGTLKKCYVLYIDVFSNCKCAVYRFAASPRGLCSVSRSPRGLCSGSRSPRGLCWERPAWEEFSLGAATLGRVFAGSGLPGKSFRWERPPWEKFSLGAASLGKVFAEEAKMAWLGCYGRANIAADSLGANDMSLDLLYTVHDLARKHTVSTFTVCISLYKHE